MDSERVNRAQARVATTGALLNKFICPTMVFFFEKTLLQKIAGEFLKQIEAGYTNKKTPTHAHQHPLICLNFENIIVAGGIDDSCSLYWENWGESIQCVHAVLPFLILFCFAQKYKNPERRCGTRLRRPRSSCRHGPQLMQIHHRK